MDIKRQTINEQIEKLKELIAKNTSKEEIKKEQKILNSMLEEYLNTNKK